jgi:hypothetical protein
MDFKVKGNPQVSTNGNISVNPDFRKAAEFCDERYGSKTKGSEECFKDFRDYYSVKLSVDLDSIERYCEEHYLKAGDVTNCIDEMVSLIAAVKKGN